jgi:hypothetical protein
MTHLAKSKEADERSLTESLERHWVGQETLRNAFYLKFESGSAFDLLRSPSLLYA